MSLHYSSIIKLFIFNLLFFIGFSHANGKHVGEVKQLEVKAVFAGNFGSTITDESGTYFNINYNSYLSYIYESLLGIEDYDPWNGHQVWETIYEPKVYVEKYQFGNRYFNFTSTTTAEDVLTNPDAGVPLYFFGTEAKITLAITNNGPRAKSKVRISSEAFVLHTDGSNGMSFGNFQTQDIIVSKGETVYVDASFTAAIAPEYDSGLDRLVIQVSHPNNGGGPGNDTPALIAEYEAIFCPPEYQTRLHTVSF